MSLDRTPSQRGRASRNKGAAWERDVARAIKPYFPDVRRSRDNGSSTTTDTGDLVDAGPGLFWSLKDDKSGDMGTPSVLAEWQHDARVKAGNGRLPVIVQKRRGHSDPLAAWCWLTLWALTELTTNGHFTQINEPWIWVRLEFEDALALLALAGYARMPAGTETAS